MKKQLLLSLGIFFLIIILTTGLILYGKGYRFGSDNGKVGILGTGLLVATSNPDGAEVEINSHLTTATNNTINLFPGNYDVKIIKEGYFPWEKNITIDKEVVSKAEALLFPIAPQLQNITLTGVSTPIVDPSYTKLAYIVASESSNIKNGIYVMDMNGGSLLPLSSGSTQLTDNNFDSFSNAEISWSPDGQQLIATISANRQSPSTYLINATTFNKQPQDVTERLADIQSLWDKEKTDKNKAFLDALSPKLETIVNNNFNIIAWSPDQTKILYTATQSAIMPIIIHPPLIGTDSTTETRSLEKGKVYIYDIKEDKNYRIENAAKQIGIDYTLSWFPDSKHIIKVHDKKIDAIEYDGSNSTTVYAGPFIGNYVYPWPNGSKMVILTNLGNPDIEPHLYTVGLK